MPEGLVYSAITMMMLLFLLVEWMAFQPFPGGQGLPHAQVNFLCKGGSELHKVLRGSERPLSQKGKLAYLQPVPRGMVFVRVAVAFG